MQWICTGNTNNDKLQLYIRAGDMSLKDLMLRESQTNAARLRTSLD